MTESAVAAADGGATDGRAARRGPRRRARATACRAVHGAAARRHGRRGHQGRGARPAGSDPRVGKGALRGTLALVAGAVAQQEVRHAQPPGGEGPGAAARARQAGRRPDRELPAGDARSGISAGSASARQSATRPRGSPATARRARTPSAQASPRSPRRWAASATSTASRRAAAALHISLGDSLAGMFAAQGILAALYKRDALGFGQGQVVDVSLLESSFAMLESMVPEYDRLDRPRAAGDEPEGRRAVEHLQVERRQVDGDRGERRQGLRAALRGDGRPELADDPRFSTHLARGEHQDEIEGRSATGRPSATPPRSTGAERGGCHLRPDLHDRRHLRGRALLGARHAAAARGSRVRRVRRPRHRPQVLRAGGALVGDVGRRVQPARSTVGCSGSPMPSSRRCIRRACCERDDLRRRPARRPPERPDDPRARGSGRARRPAGAAGCRGSRLSASSTRARAADGRRRGGRRRDRPRSRRRLRRPRRSTSGYDRLARPGSTRCTTRSPRPRPSTGATRTRPSRNPCRPRADRRTRARGRHPRDGHDRRLVRLPVRGPGRPGGSSSSPVASPRRARTRSSSPTRSASACRARCGSSSARPPGSAPRSASTSTTRATRASRTRSLRRGGRYGAGRLGRRDRRLPVRAARDGQHLHRGSRLPPPRRGHRDGNRPRRLIEVAEWLEACSGGSSRAESTCRHVRAGGGLRRQRTRNGVQARSRRRGHVHRPLPRRATNGGAQYRVKTPSTPADPSEVLAASAGSARRRRSTSATSATSSTARRSRRTRCSSRRAPGSD